MTKPILAVAFTILAFTAGGFCAHWRYGECRTMGGSMPYCVIQAVSR